MLNPYRLLSATLAALLAGCVASVSEKDIYRPTLGGPLNEQALASRTSGYVLERQQVIARDGTQLNGVLLRRKNATRTILYFGGNNFVTGVGAAVAEQFQPLNVNIMMIDYRGYGTSGQGAQSLANLLRDGELIFDHLASLPGLSPRTIVVHGYSMGSFVAGHVAATRDTGGVVLQSSATTAEDFIKGQVPGAARLIVKVKVEERLKGQGNLQNMNQIDEPMLIMVGSNDKVTVPTMSEQLFAASTLPSNRKFLAIIPKAGHNDVFKYEEAITAYRLFLGAQ